MTREGKWPLAAFVAAVLAAVSLFACGGSDSDSSSSTAATTAGATTARDNGGDREQSGSQGESPQDRNAGEDEGSPGDVEQGESSSDSGSENAVAPLEVSGGGSEQFLVKGGDNSIQEYGEEGDEGELREVAEVVHRFFVARAEEKWDTACSLLSRPNVEQLEQLGSQSAKFKDAGCGQILEAFTRPLPASLQRDLTAVDARSFRNDGEQGFLIYYGGEGTAYAMPLRNEDGAWRVAALSGTTLG